MFITFNCETCQAKLEVDAVSRGTVVQCPQCNTNLTVPNKGVGPGATVGGFKIRSLLGKGGMGEVFLARQLSMDRDIALKILPPSLTTDKEEVGRFLNEVRLGARLEHPSIVTAYEAGEDNGVYYLAMAYVQGETLESRLKKTGIMTEAAALAVARKVASALAYAWNKHHLIHRDVKPANIIMNEDGEPKLMDMGLSKSLHEAGGLTMADTVMGTPNYMSPEQAEGASNVDFRADIYALGATLYHMLTGRLPFAGKTVMDTLRKQAIESLPDPREGNASVSNSCARLVEMMLAKKPQDRYVTWEALIAEMDIVLAGGVLSRHGLPAGASVLNLGGKSDVPPAAVHKTTVRPGAIKRSFPPPAAIPPAGATKDAKPGWWIATGAAAAVLVAGIALGVWVSSKGKPRVLSAPTPAVVTPVPTVAPAASPVAPAEPSKETTPAAATSTEPPPVADPWRTIVTDEQPDRHGQRKRPPPNTRPIRRDEAAPVPPQPPEPQPTPPQPTPPQPAQPPAAAPVDIGVQITAAVEGLIRGDRAAAKSALDQMEGKSLSAGDQEVRDSLRRVLRMNQIVLDSLKADAGKDINIMFKSGPEQVHIVRVDGETVVAQRQFKGAGQVAAWVDRPFTCGDLSPMEQVRRLNGSSDPDRQMMCAVLAIEAGRVGQARQFLAGANGPLGGLMKSRLAAVKPETGGESPAPRPRNADESAAERVYRAILDSVGPPPGQRDQDEILLSIRKRKFGEIQAKKIRADVEMFKAKFGGTDCAARNRRVLDTLSMIRVNSPLYVDESMVVEACERLQKANPIGNVKPVVAWLDDGLSLDFSGQRNLLVISALAGLPVTRLDLSGTQVRDLSPLRGMPLRVFRGGQGEREPDPDLGKLASLSLADFTYVGTEIKSLQWMHGMPLTNINVRCISFNHADLRHFKGMPLESLRISSVWSELNDIAALKGMPLKSLEISTTFKGSLSDLAPLGGMKLMSLSLVNSKVIDLAPLKGMPLVRLDLTGTGVRDLKPLRGMPLKWLSIAQAPVNDINSLAGVPLEYLNIQETRVTDFESLKNIPTLKDVVR